MSIRRVLVRGAVLLLSLSIGLVACGGQTASQAAATEQLDASGSEPDLSSTADGSSFSPEFDASTLPDVDAATGDGGQSPTPLPDEPCPERLDVNCSSSCTASPTTVPCDKVACFAVGALTIRALTPPVAKPFVLRTPSHPGRDADCAQRCVPDAPAYAMSVKLELVAVKDHVRFRVAAPWSVLEAGTPCTSGPKATCLITRNRYANLVLTTDDPNAHASNAIIEDTTDDCP